MTSYLLVFIGGGLGSAARLGVAAVMGRYMGVGFPWGTLTVNLLGALLIGLLVEIAALKLNITEGLRYFLVAGLLGGFTSFSAFSLEAAAMLQRADYLSLLAYVVASVVGGVGLFFLATHTARVFF